jgi:uncharacterized GH25 family protein
VKACYARSMRRTLLLVVVASSLVSAHEAWLTPVDGGIGLRVGEGFVGESRQFTRERVKSLRSYQNAMATELKLPDAGEAFAMPSGTAELIAYDSQPSTIVLSADEFTAYLREEGLDDALASRADAGEAKTEGRERYRRSLKALLRPAAFATRTGQPLEIVPLSEPKPRQPLSLKLVFAGQPLAEAKLQAWHKEKGMLMVLSARTDSSGVATFELPYAGQWMVSAVHMTRLKQVPQLDWESTWASLTFELTDTESPIAATRLIHGSPSHGVPGPWALAGYRIGAHALKRLGLGREQAFEIEVIHRAVPSVRYTCMADGVMAATGVSPGKMNVSIEKVSAEDEIEMAVTHRKTKRQLVYRLTPTFRDRFRETDFADFPRAATALEATGDAEIFSVVERLSPK